jgi:hypothetical protein
MHPDHWLGPDMATGKRNYPNAEPVHENEPALVRRRQDGGRDRAGKEVYPAAREQTLPCC